MLLHITLLAVLLAVAPAHAQTIPSLTGATLDGVEYSLPEGLPAQRTVLMFGFLKSHNDTFDLWRPTVEELSARPDVDWLEVPFVDVGGVLKGVIGTAMRAQLGPTQQAHTMPLWGSGEPTQDALGIEGGDIAVTVVVDRSGKVLARWDGEPADAELAELRTLLETP